MGLILFGVLLVVFYILKIFFPEFIIGVAELPSIVEFGNYVDTHKWAYYLFNGSISFLGCYLICCTVCRTYKLNIYQTLICLLAIILLFIVQNILPYLYVEFNYSIMLLTPAVCVKLNKSELSKAFYPLVFTLLIHWMAQAITIKIRDISLMVSYPNSATFTILVIDAFIWLVLLYMYFNYKGDNKNG